MSQQRFPIICEFCLKVLGEVTQSRIWDMRRKHIKLMHVHKQECPHWNDKAIITMARAG